MNTAEKITTLEQRHSNEIQVKNESIIELETEIATLKTENGQLQKQLERSHDETIRIRRSLGNQLTQLTEAKIDDIALEVKKLLGVVRF